MPYWVYWTVSAALVAAGILDSIYLAVSHHRVYTDMGYQSFCAISKALNCDTVSQSSYSIFLGLPLPVWGVIGYTFLGILLRLSCRRNGHKPQLWTAFFLLSWVFSLFSVVLAFISTYLVHSYCIMCIVSYGINLLLLYYSWLVRKRFAVGPVLQGAAADIGFLSHNKRNSLWILVPFFIGVVVVWASFPNYWRFQLPQQVQTLAQGTDELEHPWIGAANPVLTITEFADYQCFQCKKMHFYLRELVARYPEKIRLVHRHFPMDHKVNPIVRQAFHVGSGALAAFAIFAATQDKFWQTNDALYRVARDSDTIDLIEIAKEVGLDYDNMASRLSDAGITARLARDIEEGIKLGIDGTPAYVIEGQLYVGQIPPALLRNILD